MFIAFFLILSYLPDGITFKKALDIAGASGKMEVLDFSFNLDNRYTIWSGLIGGTFLALSYFGTDQSQVQRYLSGKSVKEMRMGLIFNGLLKVPMQFFILLVGVMVFVFYQFNASPINFNPQASLAVQDTEYAKEYRELEMQQYQIQNDKQSIIYSYLKTEDEKYAYFLSRTNEVDHKIRERAKEIIDTVALETNQKIESNDKDYVFIHFILHNLPKGLIGLLLAVILSAAMSSTASELNALASTTAMDLYKRNTTRELSDRHMVNVSKLFTLGWGILAILIACIAHLADNLIQLVNIIGSIFYGNVLGIFLLAFFFKHVKGNAVFIAALITQVIIISLYLLDFYEYINLEYLWLNFVGCFVVMILALLIDFKNITNKDKIILSILMSTLFLFSYLIFKA